MAAGDTALVLVGHGSTTNPDSRLPTERLAASIRARGLFAEVLACFWKEPPFVADALTLTRAREVVVVPNFAGEGYFTREAIPAALGLSGPVTLRDGRRLRYTAPVGSHPRIPSLLAARAEAVAASHGIAPRSASLLLIAHGSSRPGGGSPTPETVARSLRAAGSFAEVAVAYLEQEPTLDRWPALVNRPAVIAAPLLIAEGRHGSEDIPPALGLERGTSGPVRHMGRTVLLCPGIGSDPEIVEIILERAAEATA